MNKIDRGFIKWQPFNSLFVASEVKRNLATEKTKTTKPVLSEEEISFIEKTLIEAYYSKSNTTIFYYKDGFIKEINTKIKKIDQVYKMIYLDNNIKILFNQILDIKLLQ
ncbi:MAG: YolD-like family protein [Bacilli bacterium]